MADNSLKKEEEAPAEVRRPRVFLWLAGIMVLCAVLAYIFQEQLFDLTYSDESFLYLSSLSILAALFFLYCYRVPRLGLKLLGRSVEIEQRESKISTVTFDFLKETTATDEKLAQTRRKRRRHMRRQTARQTPKQSKNSE